MAEYLAKKIISGEQSYSKVFGISVYRRYQNDTNNILIADGYGHLIQQ